MSPDMPHHRFDRALRDAWRNWSGEVAETLLGRRVLSGQRALEPHVELGQFEADGLVVDETGTVVHLEVQSDADHDLGIRMVRYFAALYKRGEPPPDQHVILLRPEADYAGIGEFSDGFTTHRYHVHRIWEIDPKVLLARPGLLRLLPLAAVSPGKRDPDPERIELLRVAIRAIRANFTREEARATAYWTGWLATLHLPPAVVKDTLEAFRMPFDLTNTIWADELRAEGQAEGRAEGRVLARRDDVRRFVVARFADAGLAERAAGVAEGLLDEAIEVVARAATTAEVDQWLAGHRS